MTYIEFFDKTAAENICTSLINPPDKVIFIGDSKKLMEKHAERYRELFIERGFVVDFEWKSVNKNNLQTIVRILCEIIEENDDCVFDLTGGDDLYLVAIGIVAERYKDKQLQMHRFNIRNGTVIDCDQDGKTITENGSLQMSIEENIRAYGGDIVYDNVKKKGTHRWDITPEFCRDIRRMWKICRKDVHLWNIQIGVLEIAKRLGQTSEEQLKITVPSEHLLNALSGKGTDYVLVKDILARLYKADLITEYSYDEELFTVGFKNLQVKRCLTKAGQALEMIIYISAIEAADNEGIPTYNDVLNGVCIDWDGEIHTESKAYDTENEIDVMMMHGIVPVFVSCKNGSVDVNELYKLNSVAHRFGSKYAKKILVATALASATDFDEYFRQRASDMNIALVEGVQNMSEAELTKCVRGFWSR